MTSRSPVRVMLNRPSSHLRRNAKPPSIGPCRRGGRVPFPARPRPSGGLRYDARRNNPALVAFDMWRAFAPQPCAPICPAVRAIPRGFFCGPWRLSPAVRDQILPRGFFVGRPLGAPFDLQDDVAVALARASSPSPRSRWGFLALATRNHSLLGNLATTETVSFLRSSTMSAVPMELYRWECRP